MCLWTIHIFPGSVHIFSCSRIDSPIMGIYKSLTDTCIWKLGLRPHNSFSGNIFFRIFGTVSLQCWSTRKLIQHFLKRHDNCETTANIRTAAHRFAELCPHNFVTNHPQTGENPPLRLTKICLSIDGNPATDDENPPTGQTSFHRLTQNRPSKIY